MNRVLMTVPVLNYTGTRGAGPVLEDGKQIVHINAVVLSDDATNNPFGEDQGEQKTRTYDDTYPCVAVKLTNPSGGITERYYFLGFTKFVDLTEEQKASGQYKACPDTGYAYTKMLDGDGNVIRVETGEFEADGKTPKTRPARARVIDPDKSATAQRILSDMMVACKVPAKADITPQEIVEAMSKCTSAIEITVTSEIFEGKRRARVTNPRAVTTAVETDAAVAGAPAARTDDDDF